MLTAGTARFRFHGSAADLLPAARRDSALERRFRASPSVKDAIEALGVPHTEVDSIEVGGEGVGFGYRLRDGDEVDVYGPEPGATGDVGGGDAASGRGARPAMRLSPPVPRPPRFVLDGHLGRLAGYLRMLGFDVAYETNPDDGELARRSVEEGRILLTRDRGLLRRSVVRLGYLPRSDLPLEQLDEVVRRFDLARDARPFSRCLRCNGALEPVSRDAIQDRLQPKTRRYYDAFLRCAACDALYWRGSHVERMQAVIDRVLGPAPARRG